MLVGNLEVYGIIYKITNKTNNKVYIGQTIYPFYLRYCNKGKGIERVYRYHKSLKECGHSYNKHLLNSIKKYGIDNFKVDEIIDVAFSKEELNIKEMTWISICDSYKNGYNQNKGGSGNSGFDGLKGTDNPASKSVMQFSLKGVFIKEWGCMTDAESELNIAQGKISATCNKNYGRKSTGGFLWCFSEDYCTENVIEYNNELGDYNKVPVVKLSLRGEFINEYDSIAEACRDTDGASVSKITNCCKGIRKSHCEFLWVYKKDYNKNIKYSYKSLYNGKPKEVVQLTLDGEYVAEYTSCTEALKSLSLKANHIGECCKGARKTYGGFLWKFKEDYYC